MNIRLATVADLPGINDIYNQAVMQRFCTAHLSPVSLSYREIWFQRHDPDQFPVYVAVDGDQISGWVSLGAYRPDRQALAHVAEISYYVHKEERGKGIGNKLMKHAIRIAPQFNFSVLIAILLSRNPVSIALLKKYDFSCWGTMPEIARIEGQVADHLYYGLKL